MIFLISVSESALTHCITKVRKTVRDDNVSQRIIKTVRGYGYRFVAPVTLHTSAPATEGVLDRSSMFTSPSVTPVSSAASPPVSQSVVRGERKQVTVLVAGLKGVAELAQRVDAEMLYGLFQHAAIAMQKEVEHFEGYVAHSLYR